MVLKKPKIDQKKLERKIAERLAFLSNVSKFVVGITRERGVQAQQGNDIVADLRNFGGFSFQTTFPATGSVNPNDRKSLKIWFHPHTTFSTDGDSLVVLAFSWQDDIATCTIEQFAKDERWQQEILSVIQRRKKICEEMDKIVRAEQQKKQEEAENRKREEALLERARSLHIVDGNGK